MATANPILPYVRRWLEQEGSCPTPDAVLIQRFTTGKDDVSFAAMVDRYGPLVLGVARRVTGDHHTAEDVFQATFLALSRRARYLRKSGALPSWLHRTAYHLGLKAVATRTRQQKAEADRAVSASDDVLATLSAREFFAVLDEELARLPDSLRLPLILCCLEGLSQEEAAIRLGWTCGSVKGRLERGRRQLRDRLGRRGLTFSTGAGVTFLLLPRSTVACALREKVISTTTSACVSPAVLSLTKGVAFSGGRLGRGAVLAAGVIAVGVAATFGFGGSGGPPQWAEKIPVAQITAPPQASSPALGMPAGATARIGASPLQVGNSAFALTPDEKEIVAVSPEGIARRFDAATGKLLDRRQLTPRNDIDPKGQFSAKISANGKMAVIQERVKGMVRLTVCDIATGKILIRRKPDPDVRVGGNVLTGNYALSPDGKVLVVREDLDVRRILRAYDTSTGRGRDIGDLEINVSDIQFSADGKRVMVSQVAGTRGARKTYLACFDVPAGKQLWKLPDIDTPFAFSPDGRTVAAYTGGRANPNGYQIIDVNPTTDETTVSFQACRRAHPNFPFVFAPDNRTLVLSFNQEMVLWDIRTAQEIGRVSTSNDSGRGYGPMVGAFSADSKTVVTNYGRLQRWNLTTGDLVFESPPGKGLGGPIEDLAFTPDGKEVIASGWCNNSARWDAVSGKRLAIHNARFGHQYVQTPDGIRSVGADDYKTPNQVTVYDPTAGQELRTVEWTGPKDVGINGLRAFALARDGRTLVVASCDEPKKVRNTQMYVTVFDSVARRQLNRFTVPGEFYFTVNAFSPCGRWAAIGGKVYQTRTGAELFSPVGNPGERLTPGDDRVSGAAWFSADGRLLAGRIEGKAADGNTETETMGVWELATDKLLLRIPKAGNTARIDFGPDGRTIALADGWGVHVFDLFDGQRMADFAAPDLNFDSVARGASTQPVAYSPDGRTLATGHKDGTITLWAVPKPADTGTAINWPVLGSESPATARAMVDQAVRNPLVAMKHLAVEFLPPQVAPDPKVAALITDLDAALFATREEAAKKLGELGAKVEPAVRQALIGQPSMEARRRLEGILSAIPPTPIQIPAKGTTLCGLRAIEILERIGTTEARALLGKWADQVQDLQLAAEARSVLSRLTPLDISKRPDGK